MLTARPGRRIRSGELTFISSAAAGLCSDAQDAQGARRAASFVHMQPQIQEVFEIRDRFQAWRYSRSGGAGSLLAPVSALTRGRLTAVLREP